MTTDYSSSSSSYYRKFPSLTTVEELSEPDSSLCRSSIDFNSIDNPVDHIERDKIGVDNYDSIDEQRGPDLVDCNDLFNEYRLECEKLLNVDTNNEELDQQKYINLLQTMVKDLLDQNETLVLNIMEIKQESGNRINELRRNLEKTAARTEEVMLSLESHELCLKNFVQEHCCECCACDMRLMEFKLCHGLSCMEQHSNHDHHPTINTCNRTTNPIESPQCWSFGHLWSSVITQTSHWLANRELLSNCLHNLSSEMRFLNLVDLIDTKIHQLENENEHLKKENQMIRELNSLLSNRNGPPLTLNDLRNNNYYQQRKSSISSSNGMSQTNHQFDHLSPNYNYQIESSSPLLSLSPIYDIIKLECESNDPYFFNNLSSLVNGSSNDQVSTTAMMDTFYSVNNTNRESFESCECRQDNDSGCSTDLLPSQTDMQSLLALSDLDDDNGNHENDEDQQIMMLNISSMNSTTNTATTTGTSTAPTKDNDILQQQPYNHNHNHNHQNKNSISNENIHHLDGNNIGWLKNRVNIADKLIPKLYNKLLYYMNQRNLLLSQFRQENRAREKCKRELSTLTECLMENLKYIETKTSTSKNGPASSTNNQSNQSILCS